MIADLLSACNSEPSRAFNRLLQNNDVISIPYRVANNYYIKNTVNKKIPARITNLKIFDQYFGMATTMGEKGQPTIIDFNHEDALIFDAGIAQQQQKILPISLKRSEGKLWFVIRIVEQKKTNYQMHNFLMLIVPKIYPGEPIFILQNSNSSL